MRMTGRKKWQGHFRTPDLSAMPSARCQQVTAEKAFLMGPVKVEFRLFWFLCPDICYKETQRVMNMVPGHKTWWWWASRDVTKWPQDWLSPVNHWSIIEPGAWHKFDQNHLPTAKHFIHINGSFRTSGDNIEKKNSVFYLVKKFDNPAWNDLNTVKGSSLEGWYCHHGM